MTFSRPFGLPHVAAALAVSTAGFLLACHPTAFWLLALSLAALLSLVAA